MDFGRLRTAALALSLLGVAASSRAETPRSLGRLERESVDEALTQLGLTIDPSPGCKLIGKVHVVNQPVFSGRDWHFQLLNVFHRTTLPSMIERELLLAPGLCWDESLADESVRNLQIQPALFFSGGMFYAAPQLSGVVAVLPVASSVPDTVDVLAVTRDLWSLRFNTEFDFQKDTLTMLRTSISENNLFGWRKLLAAGFAMDQGRLGVGPTYFDPNIAGTRLTLFVRGTAWYGRDTNRYEGNDELFSLRYPLYALASRWGAGLDVRHEDVVERKFCDEQLCPAEVAGSSLPLVNEYRRRTLGVDANVVRSFGRAIIQRVTAGYRFARHRSLVLADFPVDPNDPGLAQRFLSTWAPEPETRSELYFGYQLFTPRYAVSRDLDTFDLRESRRLGPLLAVEMGTGLPAIGADFAGYPMSASVSWAEAPWQSGFAMARMRASGRIRQGQLIDQQLSAAVYFASPHLARVARIVLLVTADALRQDSYRTRIFLGGDTGLRGYQIGELSGTVGASAHVEVRSAPLAVDSQRFGVVAFYDVGDAAESVPGLVPHHDFGLGLRWLIPQLNASVLRIDWAIPAQAGPYTDPGLPGRITAGFTQSFWLLDSPKGYLPSH